MASSTVRIMKAQANGNRSLLSHRRADCQREYCRTVMGLFEETHGQAELAGSCAARGGGRGEKKIII